MPTVIAHALVGASLTPLAQDDVPSARLATGLALLAMLPDTDVLGLRMGIPYAHPFGHRGLTHSLTFAAAAALLFPFLLRAHLPPRTRRWWKMAGLGFVACASHGLLDACTDGGLGVGLLLPFRTDRYFLPWRPIHVSPIGITPFLSTRGLSVLGSEILWVWLPTLVVFLFLQVWKGTGRPSAGRWRGRS